jgi:outer membrane protein OmpA-like peptidoglycan-associated protein
MFNLVNLIGGYTPNKRVNVSPYAGVGYIFTPDLARPTDTKKQKTVTGNVGLYASYNFSKIVGISGDFRMALFDDRFDGEQGGREFDGLWSVNLGLTFNIPPVGWGRSTTTTVRVGEREVEQMRDQLNELRKSKSESEKKSKSNTKEKKNDNRTKVATIPYLITFEIGKSVLNEDDRVNLGFLSETIRRGDSKQRYIITGYADRFTGNQALNTRLSRARAEAVRNCLVNEFGIDPNRLLARAAGGVENMFYNDPRLSRAVVITAEGQTGDAGAAGNTNRANSSDVEDLNP